MMMAGKSESRSWREGDVAYFTKLHYDKAKYCGSCNRPSKSGEEQIKYYEIEGKDRPCLIVGIQEGSDYFLVWCMTSQDKRNDGRDIEVRGVPELRKKSYLRNVDAEIRWIHRNLSGKWIGQQNKLAFDAAMKEFNLNRLVMFK